MCEMGAVFEDTVYGMIGIALILILGFCELCILGS